MKYATIYVGRIPDADYPYAVDSWKDAKTLHYTKYNIKESDFRIKTATFSSPDYIDLTTGQYCILISSKYHENFGGIILDVEYDEKTGLYNYQCQDWSRRYIWKSFLVTNNASIYRIIQWFLCEGNVDTIRKNINKNEKQAFKTVLSGLKPLDKYDQSKFKNNHYNGNPFKQIPKMIMKDKSAIEVIRSLVYGSLGYFDVWFNDRGVLQITPLDKSEWENTGLHLTNNEFYNRKLKFSTTNAITGVVVNGTKDDKSYMARSVDLIGLNLKAFFGTTTTSISQSSNENKNKSNATSNNSNNNNNTTSNNKYGNPYNNKPKNAWINADNGSDGMKHSLANALKKDGWNVHISGTGPGWHYKDYWNVTSKYSVLLMLMNGFCAGTMREAYSSKIQSVLKKKGVQLVPIWETGTWTNPNGMKPYRYGDFTGYSAKRAWDDNFSSTDPSIKSVSDFLKKNKATYCASPTASEIMQQFRAGGYFKYKGINV